MKSRDGYGSNIVLLLDERIASFLIKKQNIQIGFRQCAIKEYFTIPRCTNCQSFSHTKKKCTTQSYCGICADRHVTSSCTLSYRDNNNKCINCIEANDDDGKNRNIFHPASWSGCPTYKSYLKDAIDLKITKPEKAAAKANKENNDNISRKISHTSFNGVTNTVYPNHTAENNATHTHSELTLEHSHSKDVTATSPSSSDQLTNKNPPLLSRLTPLPRRNFTISNEIPTNSSNSSSDTTTNLPA